MHKDQNAPEKNLSTEDGKSNATWVHKVFSDLCERKEFNVITMNLVQLRSRNLNADECHEFKLRRLDQQPGFINGQLVTFSFQRRC